MKILEKVVVYSMNRENAHLMPIEVEENSIKA